jgi:EAL domain-containing protein (putative c-di-GMP-specific phosphodiesterase class I)
MIGVAEQSNLINAVGAWVLEQACRDRDMWLKVFPGAPMELAVNVSARQTMTAGFADTVAAIVAATDMDPAALVLEMTEDVLIEDVDRAMSVLAAFRSLGIRVALDDFGTGYSSLSYLRRLPIDIVKIDQGFIADIGRGLVGREIAAAVTNLAHVLGKTVTAEGVETADQHAAIAGMGCDYAQGYFYARPMPATEITACLATGGGGPPRLPRSRVAAR